MDLCTRPHQVTGGSAGSGSSTQTIILLAAVDLTPYSVSPTSAPLEASQTRTFLSKSIRWIQMPALPWHLLLGNGFFPFSGTALSTPKRDYPRSPLRSPSAPLSACPHPPHFHGFYPLSIRSPSALADESSSPVTLLPFIPLRSAPLRSSQKLTVPARNPTNLFTASPLAPLLFANDSSDARDLCAIERTFLSWLRLAVYIAVLGVSIVISFHLKNEPTPLEHRLALPLGLVFWALSGACLVCGLVNYLGTVRQYAKRKALVQSGWKTQAVSLNPISTGRSRWEG